MSLDRYFTPRGDKNIERKRKNTSPGSDSGTPKKKNSCDKMLTEEDMNELMRRFGILMDTKLDEKIDNLKAELATKVQIDALEEKVDRLQREKDLLRVELDKTNKKLEKLDNSTRRSNLVFVGLSHMAAPENLSSVVGSFITDVLGITPAPAIEEIIALGKGPACPLLAKFSRISDVNAILKNTSRLRGTNFGVNRDYSDDVRLARRCLFQFRKEIRSARPDCSAFVRYDSLVVGGETFKWSQESGVLHKNGNGLQKLNTIAGRDLGPLADRLLAGGTGALASDDAGAVAVPTA